MPSIYQNPELLYEQPSDTDYLDYSDEVSRVQGRVTKVVDKSHSTIIAYLGGFGVGKSTVLRTVKKRAKGYRWIEFETWRYANRNELWDAFVIKLVSELNKDKSESDIADEIEGTSLSRREWVFLGIWILIILIGLSVLSWFFWWGFRGGVTTTVQFGEAYLKYAVPVIFPVLLLVGLGRFLKLTFITDKRPLRRVFELENLLFRILLKIKKPLIVVVEDVDRAGNDGAVFMETLHIFLGRVSKHLKHPVIVIAPQTNNAFDALSENRATSIEHSLKVYDEKMYFNAKLSYDSIDKLYGKLNFAENYGCYKLAMIEVTKLLSNVCDSQLTIRLLKHTLREVDWFMQTYPDHNPAVVLVFAIARVIKGNEEYGDEPFLWVRRLDRPIAVPDNGGIDTKSAFGIALAIAASASHITIPKGIAFVDENSKYAPRGIRQITFDLRGEKDGVVVDDLNQSVARISVLKDYSEQLTI